MKTWYFTKVTLERVDSHKTGAALREMRLRRKVTVRTMAKRLGISASYLCDLEHGHRNWGKRRHDEYLRMVRA